MRQARGPNAQSHRTPGASADSGGLRNLIPQKHDLSEYYFTFMLGARNRPRSSHASSMMEWQQPQGRSRVVPANLVRSQ